MNEFKKLTDFEKSEVTEKLKNAKQHIKLALDNINNDWLLCNIQIAKTDINEALFIAEQNCYLCQSIRNIEGNPTCARKFITIEKPRITCCDDFVKGEIINGI